MGVDVRGIDRRRFLGMVAAAGAGGVMVAASSKASAFGFDAARDTMLPPGTGWRLDPAKSDEFNGASLDTAKWVKKYPNALSPQVEFVDENVQMSDGLLRIRLSSRSGQSPYHSGIVRSTFAIGADYYTEVRARVIGTDANAECVIRHSDADVQHIGRAGGQADEEFHIYGLERRAGKVVLYVDGSPYQSHGTHPMATEPQPLSMYVQKKHVTAEAVSADMLIDYVRVYTA